MDTKKSKNNCPVCKKAMFEDKIMYFCPDEVNKKGCGASIYKDGNRNEPDPKSC